MLKLLVIADDLTGANDTGVQFAKKGIPIFVITGTTGEPQTLPRNYQVVVVNTESRHLGPDEAARRVRRVVEQGRGASVTHFYKKTDSSLRGNIGSELEALMVASGCRVLPFIPAFPKLKRTTRDGFQYVDERPLHETAFAKDPLEPIVDSYIPGIIKRQTRIQTRIVRASEFSVPASVKFDEEGIYVLDGTNEAELQQAGELLKRNDLLKATAGSAGFAEYLPDLLGFERRAFVSPSKGGRMLVVSRSVNEVSLKQLSHAEAHGFAAVTLSPEVLVREEGAQSALAREAITRIIELDQQQREVILRSSEKSEDLEIYLERGRRSGLDLKQTHLLIAKNMGEIASQVLERTSFRLLTVFGGDTLVAVARALGWCGLLPQDEILPGVVVSRVSGSTDELLLVSKAGGFGPEDVLLRIKDLLGGRNHDNRHHDG